MFGSLHFLQTGRPKLEVPNLLQPLMLVTFALGLRAYDV